MKLLFRLVLRPYGYPYHSSNNLSPVIWLCVLFSSVLFSIDVLVQPRNMIIILTFFFGPCFLNCQYMATVDSDLLSLHSFVLEGILYARCCLYDMLIYFQCHAIRKC